MVGVVVWLYMYLRTKEQAKPEQERQALQRERKEQSKSLWNIAGIMFIIVGLGLGGFSIVPETPTDFPFWARLFFLVLGVFTLIVTNKRSV